LFVYTTPPPPPRRAVMPMARSRPFRRLRLPWCSPTPRARPERCPSLVLPVRLPSSALQSLQALHLGFKEVARCSRSLTRLETGFLKIYSGVLSRPRPALQCQLLLRGSSRSLRRSRRLPSTLWSQVRWCPDAPIRAAYSCRSHFVPASRVVSNREHRCDEWGEFSAGPPAQRLHRHGLLYGPDRHRNCCFGRPASNYPRRCYSNCQRRGCAAILRG
jgi:hypothetical protein